MTKNIDKKSNILHFMTETDAPIALKMDSKPIVDQSLDGVAITPLLGEIEQPPKYIDGKTGELTTTKPTKLSPWDAGYKPEWPPK